jgi:hypothetical protein
MVKVQVPSIRGLKEEAAREALAAVKLHLDIRDGDKPADSPSKAGTIYEQYPDPAKEPGIDVPEGTGILGIRYALPRPFAKDWDLSKEPESIEIVPPGSPFQIVSAIGEHKEATAYRSPKLRPSRARNPVIQVEGGRISRPPSGWTPEGDGSRVVSIGLRFSNGDPALLRISWVSPIQWNNRRGGCSGSRFFDGRFPGGPIPGTTFYSPGYYENELQGQKNEVAATLTHTSRYFGRDNIVRLLEHVIRQIEPYGKPCSGR